MRKQFLSILYEYFLNQFCLTITLEVIKNMAKSKIVYSDIKWDKIDYTVVSKVTDVCKAIKEYYWNNRLEGSPKSEIIDSGLDYAFLIKAFSMYHTEWDERTSGCSRIGFFVAIPPEYKNDEKNKSFHLVLDGEVPFDSSISHNFRKSDRLKQDIKDCCRDAIKPEKDELKKQSIGKLCPYKHIILTKDNIDVHHRNIRFSQIADKWIEENGGIEYLHQFVSPSINGGTITKFTSASIRKNFIAYHKEHACLEAISREAHKEIHKK